MLDTTQLAALREAHSYIDTLYDEINLDDPHQTEIEVDPGDLHQLLETWTFMFNALRSMGYFEAVRAPGIPRR